MRLTAQYCSLLIVSIKLRHKLLFYILYITNPLYVIYLSHIIHYSLNIIYYMHSKAGCEFESEYMGWFGGRTGRWGMM